ncbi:twin arginine translocase protein C [Corynebacterium kutscheri]|uniref:Sec-independent protein translocase protein TatC n=1 Tax=Corynebacterium kutscheri TaxID=35755 RepID=A0A0F6R1S1_9CORY|nr:twin-arginine translocase subunit TatC [Corynebacterium kutscheri]AKE41208.1 twin arginine targeting protein translocase subunit TatC [Corynebacterium kutscheri]VEH08484.1 twin arginine translocase protein C [Corynebacterium kutscheri]VEH09530.1 twin arginine translocase protein C [Corynebacterium kutscheri]VEH79613.1 twin arginine translocase protein C [Corynebacterium kutscheri]
MAKKKPADGSMPLVEHLQELRRRVIISIIALGIGTIVGYYWYQNTIMGLSSLGDILRGPYCSLPVENRASFTLDDECRLLATSPFEMFLLRLKVGALAGLVFASPVWLYQIWAFITPGLHKNERRATFSFVSAAVILFVAGAMIAYFVVSYGLEFLLTIGDETQVAALTGERYFNFLLALLLIFGVSFEVPLLLVMLNAVGVLTYEQVKDKRRIIVVLMFIFAAFMTPGQDPFSMLILALALSLLVECALQVMRLHDRRVQTNRPAWLDVDDEESSGDIAAAAPIGNAESVRPSPSVIDRPQPIDQKTNFDDVL